MNCKHIEYEPSCAYCAFLKLNKIKQNNKVLVNSPLKEALSKIPKYDEFFIPKKIHRIWVGPNKIPDRYEYYWETWKKHNPDYEFITWTDSDIDSFGKEISDLCKQCRNPAEVSDVLRFCIINKHGGVYIDTDFECKKNIDELLRGWEFISCYENPKVVASGFFASIPNSDILEKMVSRFYDYRIDKTVNQVKTAGPLLFTEFINTYNADYINIYPTEYFYGIKYQDRYLENNIIPETSYAVHWWSHTWEDWWTTVTIRCFDEKDISNINKSQLGKGDIIKLGVKDELETSHVCELFSGDKFTEEGLSIIRKHLRNGSNYSENCFGFLDDKDGIFWVRSSKFKGNTPLYIKEIVVNRG